MVFKTPNGATPEFPTLSTLCLIHFFILLPLVYCHSHAWCGEFWSQAHPTNHKMYKELQRQRW